MVGYWKIRGLGAPIRMLLHFLKVDFEDRTYQVGDAPDFDKTAWLQDKFRLGMDFPNLPYLIDGETKITETAAILQYIAMKWRPSLLGSCPAELARVQMFWYYVLTLKDSSTNACYFGDGNAATIVDAVRP